MQDARPDKRWKIIGRGLCGWHAQSDNTSLSGAYGEGCDERLAKEAFDGALVYDAKAANKDAFTKLILDGPLVSTSLEPATVDSFTKGDREAALRMSPLLGGGFKALALASQDESFTGLDQVGVRVYEALLREIPGIKIGHVKEGEILWET